MSLNCILPTGFCDLGKFRSANPQTKELFIKWTVVDLWRISRKNEADTDYIQELRLLFALFAFYIWLLLNTIDKIYSIFCGLYTDVIEFKNEWKRLITFVKYYSDSL